MNPLFLIDFYKVGHVSQYPEGISQVWSNWTPRSTRIFDQRHVVHFGLQYFIKKYLQDEFNSNFFGRSWSSIESEYKEVIRSTLGVKAPKVDHIAKLWAHQRLPLDIFSLPEGSSVPLNVPALVITNTTPDTFWLPNYLETLMSSVLWKPTTSATTAQRYRKLFLKYVKDAGEKDIGFIDWMGHDFSMRGMSGVEDAILSGMGHLLSFSGTDTIPAILAARDYYKADLSIGGSVPATEHSVMCAGCEEGEFETFRRLIQDIYPSGIVSVVSDTWDLWRVLTDYLPRLRDTILARDGKLVIRPDSGDPVNILCGDPSAEKESPAYLGVFRLLMRSMGYTERDNGFPMLNKVGAIYGDSITVERADAILSRMVNELQISPYNIVFGIGSYTYEYVTRDTYGFAMKATAVRVADGSIVPIFKKPITDSGTKVSHKGIPAVYETEGLTSVSYYVVQESKEEDLRNCAFDLVFHDGFLVKEYTFDQIRRKVRNAAV